MILIVTPIFLYLLTWSQASSITEETSTNKTKRTIAGQVHNYGENRPLMVYSDNTGVPAAPQTLSSLYAPVTLKPVFDPEVPKQVAAQQVLYEFQQTPTNAVSNVHVNQFYQPLQNKESASSANTGPAQFIGSSETVATPVQHSSYVRHGQNYGQVQIQPQHIQTQQYIPGKYFYVNGKIVYPLNQNQNGFQQQHGLQQNLQQRPFYSHPQAGTQRMISSPLLVRPQTYRHFQPPQPHQVQQITKPMNTEVSEEQNEEEEEENKEEEEEENENEETDESESLEVDDDDRYFSKYQFDEDDDDDHDHYREDDDEDNERGSSKTVPKKHKKKITKPNKYNKGDGYKYSESYSASSKYEKPVKKGKKSTKNPTMHYKAVKYSKEAGRKPRVEKIERQQSQNIPVVHKQKIFKEKWYVTKSTDDSML